MLRHAALAPGSLALRRVCACIDDHVGRTAEEEQHRVFLWKFSASEPGLLVVLRRQSPASAGRMWPPSSSGWRAKTPSRRTSATRCPPILHRASMPLCPIVPPTHRIPPALRYCLPAACALLCRQLRISLSTRNSPKLRYMINPNRNVRRTRSRCRISRPATSRLRQRSWSTRTGRETRRPLRNSSLPTASS